ncbi:MAG: T9SS type A sorting domain-containing protein [Saprospiraceae bacterium]|nr:T9SS type A sorting domain-containing protein [Saprospiraceae bacterium]
MTYFNKFIYSLILLVLCGHSISGQELNWLYKIGGLTAESGVALAQDEVGNIYDLTNFMGTVAVSNEITFTSSGSGDILIRKSTALGLLVWIKKIGGNRVDTGYDIVSDAAGNVYVAGTYMDTLRIADQIALIGDARPGGFVLKLDTDGNLLWALRLESSVSAVVKSLTLDKTGDLIVAGNFEGILDADQGDQFVPLSSAGNADIFYAKYNTSGALIWAYKTGSTDIENLTQIITDTAGHIYITGEFRAPLTIDVGSEPITILPSGLTDAFLIKFDGDGVAEWAKAIGGVGFDSGYGIAVDPQNHILLTGRYANTVNFNGIENNPAAIRTSKGSWDGFVLKLTQEGEFVWVTSIGGTSNDQGRSITTNNNGIIYVSGMFRDTVDFDNHSVNSEVSASAGGDDIFYLILNQDGTYNDHFAIGGVANEQITDVMLKNNKELISTGAYGAIVNFDPFGGNISIFSTGGLDAFLLNFSICVNPYIKELIIEDADICWGDRGIVRIAEGYLNGATQWSWQRNNCDAITFASGDFIDLRLIEDVSYFVKGSGGCITEENCLRADFRVFTDTFNYQAVNLCEGESFQVGENVYTIAGVYVDSLVSVTGCDSVMITEIATFPSYSFNESYSICQGDTVFIGTNIYTTGGTYINAYQTVAGCDSIITSIVNVIPVVIDSQFISICQGDTFTLGEEVYTESGIYIVSTTSNQGCEDFLVTVLNVIPAQYTQTIALCEGDSLVVGSNIYKDAGTYTDNLGSVSGCDSIVTSIISVNPVFTMQQDITLCEGDSIQVGNVFYFSTGNYIDTLQTVSGCDSIIHTDIRVLPVPTTLEIFVDLCKGESWEVGGNIYSVSGVYSDTLQAFNGCDSIIISHVRIQETNFTQNVSICEGESYPVGTSNYTLTGVYINVFQASTGCDSILITNLTVIAPVQRSQNIVICPGDTFQLAENIYLEEGIFNDTLTSLTTGCDSIIITNLKFRQTTFEQEINLCLGESITIAGNTYNTSGVFTDSLISVHGCDSIIISDIRIYNTQNTLNEVICEGDAFVVGNSIYTQSGIYTDNLIAANGCDSIITTILEVIPTLFTEGYFELCPGDSIVLGNTTYFESIEISDTLTSSLGCDSIVHITVNFKEIENAILQIADTLTSLNTVAESYQWLSCSNGLLPIIGADSISFVPDLSGLYALQIFAEGCTNVSGCYVFVRSATDDQALFLQSYYPNPVTDILTIETSEIAGWQLTDATGKTIHSGRLNSGKNQIDFSQLPSGLYLIQLVTAQKRIIHKIVKI